MQKDGTSPRVLLYGLFSTADEQALTDSILHSVAGQSIPDTRLFACFEITELVIGQDSCDITIVGDGHFVCWEAYRSDQSPDAGVLYESGNLPRVIQLATVPRTIEPVIIVTLMVNMSPSAILPTITDVAAPKKDTLGLPEATKARLTKAGIDLSEGYPYRPSRPLYLQDVYEIRNTEREFVDAGIRADKSKQALLSAATKVTDLTTHIGTEIEGLQLKDLTSQQRDELALLIAERSVVFFRDQDISPQQQKELGEWYGEIEVHPQVPQVPGVPGVTVIWPALQATELAANFRNPGGASRWHSDLVHERQPAGITHLHNDTVPPVGGDTLWASGYAAYEKLSPDFRKIIDGKKAVYRSAHSYLDRDDPTKGPKFIERIHPLVRVHPATGWKALWVNRAMTVRIVGLDKAESDVILNYLYDVYEKNVDIQVRFRWTPGTSALWDNRITIHNASWDYGGNYPRHGTRVTALAETPFFDHNAPTRREALGQLGEDEKPVVDGVLADG